MDEGSRPGQLDYIDDMLEAAHKIERYTDGMSHEEFVSDEKTVDAVLRNLEILGEASKLIAEDVREHAPEIPWSDMAGMRDKLIHGYATIDLDIVWRTVTEEVPHLRSKLDELFMELED